MAKTTSKTMQEKPTKITQILYDPDKDINPEYVCTGYMSAEDNDKEEQSEIY